MKSSVIPVRVLSGRRYCVVSTHDGLPNTAEVSDDELSNESQHGGTDEVVKQITVVRAAFAHDHSEDTD